MEQYYRLLIRCPDCVGVVAGVAQFIAAHNGWLTEASYHSDEESGLFFMRNEIKASSLSISLETFCEEFKLIADQFQMEWRLVDTGKPKKMVILASHASHCMADLLHRWKSQDLCCDISAVISNHEKLRDMVEWHGIPFHYVSAVKAIESDNKSGN